MSSDPQSFAEELQKTFGKLWISGTTYPAVKPKIRDDVADIVDWARTEHWKLLPVGRGSSISSKYEVPENVLVVLSLGRSRIFPPDPSDLTVDVEAGASAMDLTELSGNSGFRLDGWPTDYPGTVGGLICGEKGMLIRHLLLGVEIIDGRGVELKFGGRTRKNVSGFDVPCLFAGSRGSLGWLDRITLRLTPVYAQKLNRGTRLKRTSMGIGQGLFGNIVRAFDPERIFLKPTI